MQQTAHRKQKLENDGGLGGGKVGKTNLTKKRNNEGGVGGSAGCAVGVCAQASMCVDSEPV